MVIRKINLKRFLAVTMPVTLGILEESEIRHHYMQTAYDVYKFLKDMFVKSEHFGNTNVHNTHETTVRACDVYHNTWQIACN